MRDEQIIKNAIKCEDCYWGDKCPSESGNICEHFTYLDENTFEEKVLPYIREHVHSRVEKRLTRKSLRSRMVSYDDSTTPLDDYYVGMINDTLSEIRRGRTAYLYSLEQVWELLSFEPTASIYLKDDTYYVQLPLNK
jgi:hypothetical protein